MTRVSRTLLGVALAGSLCLGLLAIGTLREARAAGSEPLLPKLVADPPTGVFLETSSTEGGVSKLLLRFNGYVHNKGPGALDFRGRREAPKVSQKTIEEVQHAKEREEGLPQKTEEELAVPPMQVFQRLFTTLPGVEETNIERAHVEESSSGEMIYVSADGHHHWHLQRVAKYSLWNASKTAEVAPAQKVGFCLEDSEHVESTVGPSSPVYADNVPPYRRFCQAYNPDATSLFEGISPGWRDLYASNLAFQWVDASNVLPGEYWLREDVNPIGFIKETGGANTPAYATGHTIIPGFDALAQSLNAPSGQATNVTLTSQAWNDSAAPRYTTVSQPQHGTLEEGGASNKVIYRPAAGYTGPDSFTFSASDPNSAFPTHPAIATVSIEVDRLLAGDATATYTVADATAAGHQEAFQFTAKATGAAEELQLRTDGSANAGITGVSLGIFAEGAGKPGSVLGGATVSGEPPVNSWIKATGLSIPVVSGTNYWLAALPLGGGRLHYDVAAAPSAGTPSVESATGGLATLTAESSWVTFDQGPVGFQAIGTAASISVSGAQAQMTAGTSVQLTANAAHATGGVEWEASAGTIAPEGAGARNSVYTAPSQPPPGGTVTITARLQNDHAVSASLSITIAPAQPAAPAPAISSTPAVTIAPAQPAAPAPAISSTPASSGIAGYKAGPPRVTRPRAMLVGRVLVMSTVPSAAGRVRLDAYLGRHRLGRCASKTPGGRRFTCRIRLGHNVSLRARIRIVASLRVGSLVVHSVLGPRRIPQISERMAPVSGRAASATMFWRTGLF
jgi:Lysyl oxidase/Bacterial Ig domain